MGGPSLDRMRAGRPGEVPAATAATIGQVPLWFGFLGGALGWSAHLLLSYGLIPVACAAASDLVLHVVTLVTAGICLAAGIVAWWCWRRLNDGAVDRRALTDPDAAILPKAATGRTGEPARHDRDRSVRRARFMAITGLWTSGLFFGVTVVEGLPVFLQDACL
jgi:hypothetical protein